MGKITKAVIPAAGLGTRFLPATKAMPKEMLPIVDKPVIQFVVEEAVEAGVPHILMVTGRNKNALENHFDRAVELENLLDQKGDTSKLSKVNASTDLADIHYVRQGDPLGLGHAVWKAKSFIGNEAFALLLGDEIIDDSEPLLATMLKIAEDNSASVVALMEVPEEELHNYGVAEVSEINEDRTTKLRGLIEKPEFRKAPSKFAVVGRYVLQPGIFQKLEELDTGFGGEIQLTDALNAMAVDESIAGPVFGYILKGKRYDTGQKLSFLKTTVELASRRPDIGEEFFAWLQSFVGSKS